MVRRALAALCGAVVAGSAAGMAPGADIPPVTIDLSLPVTVSGISSGAFMAVQMHFSFSELISGVGVLAGGPYWCAQDDVLIALSSCSTSGGFIDVPFLASIVANTEAFGFIAPTSNLRPSRVWLLSALNDSIVDLSVVQKTAELYMLYLGDAVTQMDTQFGIVGQHSQLTDDYGSACTYLGSPYINNCAYDAAGALLQFLMNGTLTPPARHTGAHAPPPASPYTVVFTYGSGAVYSFDQGLFVGGGGWDTMFGLAETAFVYIPDACLLSSARNASCALHVAFHGCEMTTDNIGTQYVQYGGYLPWADANNMVVLFPQAISNLLNPKGCFDWWGYAGTAYASNAGTQTLAVRNMMDVIMAQPITPNKTATAEGAAAFAAWQAAQAALTPIVAAGVRMD